jgi:arginase
MRMHSVRIIGVPLDLGASRRGVDMGPSALRIARLVERLEGIGYTVEDGGNLIVSQREQLVSCGRDALTAIAELSRELATVTAQAVRDGAIPLVLGGDHSLAMGSVAGVATALAERGEALGVIWLDAHGDINTPETSAVRPERLVMVGIRDLDPPEQRHIGRLGVTAFTMRDIDERGLKSVMAEAIAIAGHETGGIHVSCDPDWIDPMDAPGVGTPVRGGATYREGHLALEMVADSGRLVAMDLVEINPVLDERNRTAAMAVDLIVSAFGKRIL